MMYLTETNLISVVKKQLRYKLKSYSSIFISMIAAQAIALLFSFNGVMQGWSSDDLFEIEYKIFSGDIIFSFTLFWALITTITITTKPYQNFDFMFISNRISSNLSNIIFIGLFSIIGSLSALLFGILLRVILFFTTDAPYVTWLNFVIPPKELLLTIFVTTMYVLLVSAIGYFSGTLFQINKLFVAIIPMTAIGLLRVRGHEIFIFFLKEESLFLFTAKVLVTVILLFISSLFLTNQMEVRK